LRLIFNILIFVFFFFELTITVIDRVKKSVIILIHLIIAKTHNDLEDDKIMEPAQL